MVLSDDELAQITALISDSGDDAVGASSDVHWLLYCGVLVFLMQAGFAMLCAGSIRAKNAQNILLKNLMDACVGATWFWATGYAFARSDSSGGNWFIGGNKYFFLSNGYEGDSGFHDWFFQFAFAATAATIVSAPSRAVLHARTLATAVLTGFVYPVVVHWIWSGDGFLTAFVPEGKTAWLKVGVVDFAGCGVVHMVGGAAAGIGAAILGPRLGRFGPNAKPINGHSMPLVVLGTFLLWVGWYGFNPGRRSASPAATPSAKVAVTTTLAAAAGGLTNLFLHYALSHVYDVGEMCNGVLAGLVSITSACAVVEPWAAVVIGFVGAFVYTGGSFLLVKLEIDDAVNATPVHYFAGAWGLLAPALFARPYNMRAAYGNADRAGLFYTGDGSMLACQVVALLLITAWVAATMTPFFLLMNALGIFRVSREFEEAGLDESKHGGSAYGIDFKEFKEVEMQIKTELEA
ncbi:ammonium transmembrane transporter [Aureococcus anophagefferens]|nr:ammonium transmembrane transporter [Aureococcus anophagefferens]